MNLGNVETILLDADGVLWRGNEPVPSIRHFFDTLKSLDISWGIITNNGTRTVEFLMNKLGGFGINAKPETIITSAIASADFLTNKLPVDSSIYVVGELGIKDALGAVGFNIFDGDNHPSTVDAVVVGIDREISYSKIAVASRLIRSGALYIATNTDATFPTPEGLDPGAGSIVAAVSTAAGKEPIIMGKPSAPIFETALNRLNAKKETTITVGDRLETDILGANESGLSSVLVLTGVSRREDVAISGIQPDSISDDIGALADALAKAKRG